MAKPDIIVVGASAGGVEALKVLAACLPPDLNASVFVVLHIGSGINGHSYLPEILLRSGPLVACSPKDGDKIQKRTIYIAPPDCHLLLEAEHVRLSHGPKENRTRPAINPLFRSAARVYGERVIGTILTGLLDDGVAGLAEIKRAGGLAVVEDPETAMFPSMPLNALKSVDADHVAPLAKIGSLLAKLSSTEHQAILMEETIVRKSSDLTCPECRGPLTEERQGRIVEFRCRVGHVYTPLIMDNEHRLTVERSLWSAIVALEEAADISELLLPELGAHAQDEARVKRGQAAILKTMLTKFPVE